MADDAPKRKEECPEPREEKERKRAKVEIYVFKNGYRFAIPWWDTWAQNVRGKWFDRKIEDVLTSELPLDITAVNKAIECGHVKIKRRRKTDVTGNGVYEYVLNPNEKIVYKFHRHEPEVLDTPIVIIQKHPELVVVRKPATMPVHPIGRFKRCSLINVLKYTYPELGDLFICHRLDRLVSGCMVFARNKDVAKILATCFAKGQVEKTYVARVLGDFPDDHITVEHSIGLISETPPVYGKVPEDKGGKPACTSFALLKSLGDGTSLVYCYPKTGRTHQIRVHLASTGHPIANDLKYGGDMGDDTPPPGPPEHSKETSCLECQGLSSAPTMTAANRLDKTTLSKGIWLHAMKYKFKSSQSIFESKKAAEAEETHHEYQWEYEDNLPSWALD
eukprot:m.344845 g.344845  ORF g.344845 m.344845 type:complete len:390 (+) comp25262_c0_seq1:178-1347(+)